MHPVYQKNIKGFPCTKSKSRGDKNKIEKWKNDIINQTQDGIGFVKGECKIKVVFKFDPSQYPADFPFGPDLDNHIKSLWDALNQTVFKLAPGHDSCVKILHASKYPLKNSGNTGAKITISLL